VTGSLVSSGCASLDLGALAPQTSARPSHEEVSKILAELDRQLVVARSPVPRNPLLRAVAERDDERRGRELAASALESLLVTGSFRVQPLEVQVHPEMQSRIRGAMPGIDRAAIDMRDHLGSYTPTERADLTRRLRRDPKLFERIADALDDEGARCGIDQMRRLHTRRIVAHAGARLSHSSELFIDEIVQKVDRLRERDHSLEATERRLVARLGEAKLAELVARARQAEEDWASVGVGPRLAQLGSQPAPPYGAPYGAQPLPTNGMPHGSQPWAPPPRSPHPAQPKAASSGMNGLLVAGGVLMGFSALSGLTGGLIVASGEIVGAFLLTLGGVLLLVGLILLIVGAVRD
jgi:hypothetical protein